jgi:cytochrome c5
VTKADDIFYRQFGLIVLLLTLFTVSMFFLARAIGGTAFERIQDSEDAVLQRIQRVGEVRIGEPGQVAAAETTQLAAAQPAAAPAAGGKSGEEVYNGGCLACHATGVAGAPKPGDKAAWEPRMAQGLDGLVNSVIKGKNAMPPKGGNPNWSDEEIRNAVTFMLDETGLSG